jgi:16S rRNA processing protein RimM
MVVRGERERLVPWIMGDVVKSVSLDERTIVVNWDPDF